MRTYLLMIALLVTGLTSYAQRNGHPDARFPHDMQGLDREDRAFVAQFNQKQREARVRIARGIENGLLTPNEAIRLLDEYQQIEIREQRALANGRLTNRERRQLIQEMEDFTMGIRFSKQNEFRNPNGPARAQQRTW